MLYHLLYPLRDLFFGFNVFKYITFRSAGAVLTAITISFILGPKTIEFMKKLEIGQYIRKAGPESHYEKKGTPTMGGVLIIVSVVCSTLLWANLKNHFIWIVLYTLVVFGVIGFIDDYLQVRKRQNEGLNITAKLAVQGFAAGVGICALYFLAEKGMYTTRLGVPFFKEISPLLGWVFIPLGIIVITGSSNAVNLTDGLDGLAVGSVMISTATYTILVYVAGHAIISDYLNVINVKGSGEVTVFCASVVGASLGFLWFNSHPAQIFMGDTGSLSLGAAIGMVAVIVRQELLLLIVGGLFVVEALSVMIQVLSFKIRGKRVFRMAPLHHHFEKKGWHESKVIIRFWIIAIMFALLSLSTLKLR